MPRFSIQFFFFFSFCLFTVQIRVHAHLYEYEHTYTVPGTRDGPYRIVTGLGYVLRDYAQAPKEMIVASYPVPAGAVAKDGLLTVMCEQMQGAGGSGHTCQISEAWLIEGSETASVEETSTQ